MHSAASLFQFQYFVFLLVVFAAEIAAAIYANINLETVNSHVMYLIDRSLCNEPNK
jgi:hypothetical protein